MKIRAAIAVLALAATACGGGNWSNKDLEFLSALPNKEELKVRPPENATSQSPLTGTGQRRDELVGQPSTTITETQSAARAFNDGLDGLLGVIEAVRKFPPTSRDGDRRIWGPYATIDHPGFESRMVMSKVDERDFAYRVEFSQIGSQEWFSLLDGSFLATSGVRGAGGLTLHAKRAREGGLTVGPGLDELDVTYSTTDDPVVVIIDFNTGTPTRAKYESRRYADGRGRIRFTLFNVTIPSLAGPQTLAVTSGWLASGEGRSERRIVAGSGTGLENVECWDEGQITRYSLTWAAIFPTGVASANCSELAKMLQ